MRIRLQREISLFVAFLFSPEVSLGNMLKEGDRQMLPENQTYTLFNIAEILGCAASTPYKYRKRYIDYFQPYQINGAATRFSYQGLMLFSRIYRWSTQDKLTVSQIHDRLARMYPGIQNKAAISLGSGTATVNFTFWFQSQFLKDWQTHKARANWLNIINLTLWILNAIIFVIIFTIIAC
jgi:hypothetical protein